MYQKAETNEKSREREAAEEILLMYFNSYLFENGIITQTERNRMITKISGRKKNVERKTLKA